MDSIIQKEKECYVCKSTLGLHSHHIFFGTANRKQSEKYGMKVNLCYLHHNGSNEAVHMNRTLDLYLKEIAQRHFEERFGDREEFIRVFGKNYLD
jgi:hypothetical protein